MEKSLDTGNILFYNLDCDKCFTPKETIVCKLKQKITNHVPDKASNMAFLLRSDEYRLMVLSDTFGSGKVTAVPYHEFINKPYIRMVKVRQFEPDNPPKIIENSLSFVKKIKENA